MQPPPNNQSPFGKLPIELVRQILSFLPARDLGCISATCRSMAKLAAEENLWEAIVNSNLPEPISDPGPFESFRRLYLAHFSYWFIPKYKIWFSDRDAIGNLVLARYDNRRGVIEAYRIIAERPLPHFHHWPTHPTVMVPSFDPDVKLWLDDPILFLKDPDPNSPSAACQAWRDERRMIMGSDAHHVFNSLVLCSNGRPQEQSDPSREIWPPSTIPSKDWVFRDWAGHVTPEKPDDVSDRVFRIRQWVHFRFSLAPSIPSDTEAIFTYATPDPELYTPTMEKPYQGIWVGDYSAHGCEFLLIYQGDRVCSEEDNEDDGDNVAMADGVIQKGRLEAVKLTGDDNVPRGKVTFRADDIGPKGLVRVAHEKPFPGARIVRSNGLLAGRGFRDCESLDSVCL